MGTEHLCVLLKEAWVHDETIIEALNFLEGVSVMNHPAQNDSQLFSISNGRLLADTQPHKPQPTLLSEELRC